MLKKLYKKSIFVLLFIWVNQSFAQQNPGEDHIQPYSENPSYWQYKGKPVLLIGGTKQDNLFNHPDLEPYGLQAHLDLLVDNGGNYVRNTMSSRNPGNRYPHKEIKDGFYDLTQWDVEYWRRFEDFLEWSYQRDIIVQIEIWDPWDMYQSLEESKWVGENIGWENHPFNPENNINYTVEESRLPTEIDFFPSEEPTSHSFFYTVPEMNNNQVVLPHQQAFIDQILTYTFEYPHVLYTMNNETGESVEWGDYWVRYIQKKADEAGVRIYATDMRRNEYINDPDHRYIHDRPERYTFIEISQNNGSLILGQEHWDSILTLRSYIKDKPRPLNNVKIYGGTHGWGGVDEGVQKFWRNIFAGSASARFHRNTPGAGIGLTELSRANLRSMRMVADSINIFRSEPNNRLLSDREENEAYVITHEGVSHTVYFPGDGSVTLDLTDEISRFRLSWLDIESNTWVSSEEIAGGRLANLKTPGKAHQVAILLAKDE